MEIVSYSASIKFRLELIKPSAVGIFLLCSRNNFFASIGPESELAAQISNSKKNFNEYLPEETQEAFVFANITYTKILDSINKLRPKNCAWPDNISSEY